MNTIQLLYAKKIADNASRIKLLKNEMKVLANLQEKIKTKKGILQWIDYTFQSSSGLTPEFAEFAKDFKKHIKTILPDNCELVNYNRGHFYLSGFIKLDNKFVYFSTSDVRSFKNGWNNNILIRTAKNDKDFTGGVNNFTSMEKFTDNIKKLLS